MPALPKRSWKDGLPAWMPSIKARTLCSTKASSELRSSNQRLTTSGVGSTAANLRPTTITALFPPTATSAGYGARGISWSSAQFLFDPDEFKFVKNNWIFLDHDQRITASLGGSYTWQDWKGAFDILYGSGLHRGFANIKTVPEYSTVNLSLQRNL